MDKYFQIKSNILKYVESDDDIKAIVAIGSSTRSDVIYGNRNAENRLKSYFEGVC